ncbi:hypothetical protein CVT25_014873 [Psilocybe cyanescens]|uniref:Uncharacterized protein n=1 Tax=Psilocybe cyanescens TaxID=93625 RepID=A0A409XT03_PSICY|nr:hypothetical protein CVT25_014873 [Psilocybe cyanescens]
MVYNFFSYLDETVGEAMLSWYYAFISIGTSRLILEMWKLPISEAEDHSLEREGSGEVHLTTFNEFHCHSMEMESITEWAEFDDVRVMASFQLYSLRSATTRIFKTCRNPLAGDLTEVAALAAQTWEAMICFTDEVEYLWSAGVGLVQVALVFATLVKLILRYRSGKSRTPLASMVLNQGLATFVLVFALVTNMMVYNFLRDLDMGVQNSLLSWYNALLSIGTSRLVLEMRKLSAPTTEEHNLGRGDLEQVNSVGLTVFSESLNRTTTSASASAYQSTNIECE